MNQWQSWTQNWNILHSSKSVYSIKLPWFSDYFSSADAILSVGTSIWVQDGVILFELKSVLNYIKLVI